MSRRNKYMVFAVLLIGALAAVLPDGAVAATAACTSIGNTASIDYQVGGVPQTTLTTGPSATFTVGNKVDLTVTTQDGAIVTVVTGASGTGAPLTFRVTNAGNATQRYTLSAIDYANGEANPFGAGVDAFNATVGYTIHVESGGVYGAATTQIDSLVSGASATVQIRANTIPLAQPNGDIAVVALKALTINTDNSIVSVGTGTVFNAAGGTVCTGVDIVLADIDSDGAQANDGLRDGAYLAKDAYQVQAVVLSVLKSSVTITDAVFGTAKVPGAIIEYRVRVTRTGGGGSATGIVISDTVPATTAPVADQYGGTFEVSRTTFNFTGSVTTTTFLDSSVPADVPQWATTPGATVQANCGAFVLDEANDYCEIAFRVQIQ